MKRIGIFLAALLLLAASACGDELKLKDGSKIVGTIVGFEDNSFKVQTSYGFALVRRDQVVSISVANPAPSPTSAKKTAPPETFVKASRKEKREETSERLPAPNSAARTSEKGKTLAPAPQPTAVVAKNHTPAQIPARASAFASPAKATPSPKPAARTHAGSRDAFATHNSVADVRPAPARTAAPPASNPARIPAPLAKVATVSPPRKNPPPVAPAATNPAAEPMQEEVVGNSYINQTFGFALYKPPGWEVIEHARQALPGAIVAMGTPDESTYLIIGLEPPDGTLAAHIAATNERLANMFENFQPTTAKPAGISGVPALEYGFTGSANGQEWSGAVALLERNEKVFLIFGVTSATSDLVQIQENVIARAISSLQFTRP